MNGCCSVGLKQRGTERRGTAACGSPHSPATCGPASRAEPAAGGLSKWLPYLLPSLNLHSATPIIPSHEQTAKQSKFWAIPLLLTALSPSSCFLFKHSAPAVRPEQERAFLPLGHLGDAQLPLALPDLQRWSQPTGRGSAVTMNWTS